MEINLSMYISRESICTYRRIRRYADGRVGSWATIETDEEGYVTGVRCVELTPIIISYGSYHEPPEWDVDTVGELIIQPIMKCWGKGLHNCQIKS
jgi:hypothetical protein